MSKRGLTIISKQCETNGSEGNSLGHFVISLSWGFLFSNQILFADLFCMILSAEKHAIVVQKSHF